MNSPKATRVHLSIAKRIEILDCVKKTKMKKEVCLRYNLAPSTLSTIMKNEKTLREKFDKNTNSQHARVLTPNIILRKFGVFLSLVP